MFHVRRLIPALVALAAAQLVAVAVGGPPAAAAPAVSRLVSDCNPTVGASSLQKLCLSVRLAPGRRLMVAEQSDSSTASEFGYGPADLQAAYSVPSSTATPTVAVVDAYGDSTIESDLAQYRSAYGLPACMRDTGCLTVVNQRGGSLLPYNPPSGTEEVGWRDETALDVEMVSAICPNCRILVVQAADDDSSGQPNLEQAVAEAATLGAKYVSMSWGGNEEELGSNEPYFDSEYLGAPGVVYTAAAGDDGPSAGYGVDWPAADPSVVAVGGTSLLPADNARGFTETAWEDADGGAAAGCSRYEQRPGWQKLVVRGSSCDDSRAVTDVSMVADPKTGVATYSRGAWGTFGGTSASAPMIAAMYALADDVVTTLPAAGYPYWAPVAAFTDITSGSGATCTKAPLCTAGTGWDGPTGVGSPVGLAGFRAPAAPVIRFANPGNRRVFLGRSQNISLTATDSLGLPLSYSVTGLPPGCEQVWAGNEISCQVRRSGVFAIAVRAHDGAGAGATIHFTDTVVPNALVPSAAVRVAGTRRAGDIVRLSFGTFRTNSSRGALANPRVAINWYLNGKLLRVHGAAIRIPAAARGKRMALRLVASKTYYRSYARSLTVGRIS